MVQAVPLLVILVVIWGPITSYLGVKSPHLPIYFRPVIGAYICHSMCNDRMGHLKTELVKDSVIPIRMSPQSPDLLSVADA